MKIKVHCVGIVDYAARPHAVLVADIKAGKGRSARYVLLSYEQRFALREMARAALAGALVSDYDSICKYPPAGDTLLGPATVRTHAFDAAGNMADGEPLHRRAGGSWINCEDLWVRTDVAEVILRHFAEWRAANRRTSGYIWAPNWHAFVAVQACALACGAPVPTADALRAEANAS